MTKDATEIGLSRMIKYLSEKLQQVRFDLCKNNNLHF